VQYLVNRKTGRADFESLAANDIKGHVYGNTALVTYRSTAKGKDQQGPIDEQRLCTRVFVRGEGCWQLVHSQGTSIQRPCPSARGSGGIHESVRTRQYDAAHPLVEIHPGSGGAVVQARRSAVENAALSLPRVSADGWPHAALLWVGDIFALPDGRVRFALFL
jgi:hypothetical protein